jgi:peptide/nickel transport system permease protein
LLTFLLRRLLQIAVVVVGVTLVTFCLLRLTPGDPCRAIHGQLVPQEVIDRCRVEHGFDRPIWQQYLAYVGDLLQGDLGQSLVYRRPALDVLWQRLPVTVFLAVYSGLLSVIIALPLGLAAALHTGSALDRFIRGATATALTLPAFWIGLLLMLVFSLRLRLFPASGYGETLLEHLRHLFLPALTLAIANGALLARVLRRSLLDVLALPHVLAVRAKGLPWQRVVVRHILRNGLISPVTLLGLQLAGLLGGAVIVEKVFTIPGLGALLLESITNRDYALVQNATLFFALIVTAVSLLVDLAYPLLDPRVRYE